jgi:hypothetical protein
MQASYYNHDIRYTSFISVIQKSGTPSILPFGILGDAAHKLFVKKQLEEIFDYRNKKIIEVYG